MGYIAVAYAYSFNIGLEAGYREREGKNVEYEGKSLLGGKRRD